MLKNEFEAKEIQDQSEKVYEAANKAHDGAVKVIKPSIGNITWNVLIQLIYQF